VTDDTRPAADGGTASGRRTDGSPTPSGRSRDRTTTVVARTVVKLVVPIIVVTALALLFQGHNRPGGGFIGAVLTVTAVVLVYVTFGLEYLQRMLFGGTTADAGHGATEWYRWLFAGGLALAAGSGLAPLVFGRAFLTQGVAFPHGLPLYGELEVATALAFDLGVYATVVGGLLTVVAEVGEE
jgi:multicomponent Na+:H+ antiporter subunit B